MNSDPPQPNANNGDWESSSNDPEEAKLLTRLDNLLSTQASPVLASYSLMEAGFRIGQYSIERAIGSGGFGVVYLARDIQLDRFVALKVPRPEVMVNSEKLKRFRSEATLAAKLHHPLIVPVYEANLDGGTPYIASAFCDGPNLMEWLEQNDATQISPIAAARLVGRIAAAVSYAHQQGIVHRDLKPANIILVHNKDEAQLTNPIASTHPKPNRTLDQFSPRLTDFGLARLQQQAVRETTSSLLIGSPNYMSPEQAEGHSGKVGPRSDIFSLGAVLYEMLTGVAPFEAESYPGVLQRLRDDVPVSITKQRPEIHRDLETICLKCLEKSPADRFDSSDELANELTRYVAGQPIHSRRLSRLRSVLNWTLKPSRVREAMMAVIAISALRIAFAFGGVLMIILSESDWTPTEMWEATRSHLMITTPIELGIAFAAWRNARQSLPRVAWWAVMTMLCVWIGLCFSLALSPSLAPGWYQKHSGARVTTFSLLAILFAGQAVCWWLGDWQRIRRRFDRSS